MSVYLVTGGAGFIGSHLVHALLDEGHTVRVLDDFSNGRWENIADVANDITLIVGSVANPTTCAKALAGVEYVFHEAALGSVPRSIDDPATTNEANVSGTLNMLVAAKNGGVRRFVFAGSSSSYGNTPVLPKEESMPANPRSPYAVSKHAAELYCQVFHQIYGLETVVLRYFNVFGPRQNPESQYAAVIPKFIQALSTGAKPVIFGDGEQTRDFTYVADAVQANLKAVLCPQAAGGVFNVSGGKRISINYVYGSVCRMLGADVEPVYHPSRAGDVRDSLADTTRASTTFRYRPAYTFDEGLAETVQWFRQYWLSRAGK